MWKSNENSNYNNNNNNSVLFWTVGQTKKDTSLTQVGGMRCFTSYGDNKRHTCIFIFLLSTAV